MRARGAPLLLSCLLAFGCSLDYRGVMVATTMPENVPDTVLDDLTTTSVRGASAYFRIEAGHAETFGRKNETILTSVKFQEFDKNGKAVTEGSADRVVYHTDTRNAELSGNLKVYSSTEDAHVSADYLYWNDDDKTLQGRPGSVVVITKDSGSLIEGTGFSAEIRTRTVRFSGAVRGTWVGGSDDEGN